MEDFFDIKTTRIEGRTVSLFGVFDGTPPFCKVTQHCVVFKSTCRVLNLNLGK